MKNLVIISLLFLVVGCAGPEKRMQNLSLGMNKAQVYEIMGKPYSISAIGNTEYLVYQGDYAKDFWFHTGNSRYLVRLIDGKVQAFGHEGDFDLTKDATIEVKIKQ